MTKSRAGTIASRRPLWLRDWELIVPINYTVWQLKSELPILLRKDTVRPNTSKATTVCILSLKTGNWLLSPTTVGWPQRWHRRTAAELLCNSWQLLFGMLAAAGVRQLPRLLFWQHLQLEVEFELVLFWWGKFLPATFAMRWIWRFWLTVERLKI